MSWAVRRKLLYFLGTMLVLGVLVGIPAFALLYHKPTCFDRMQNQGEDGVDCGGPCSILCRPLQLAPVVVWQQVFKVTPGIYTAAAYVQNPNVAAEAYRVPYTFSLYDSSNVLIGTRTGTTHIPPGKTFAVIETGIDAGTSTPTHVFFEFGKDIPWVNARGLPDLAVNNTFYSNLTLSPIVDADIKNLTRKDVGQVAVIGIVYDSRGNAIAASRTYIDGLPPLATQHVTFTWPLPFSAHLSHVEIIPDIQ